MITVQAKDFLFCLVDYMFLLGEFNIFRTFMV